MKASDTVRMIRKAKPVRDVLDYTDGKLDVVLASSSLFSDINASLPSGDIIEYLYDIASSSSDDLRIVLPPDSDEKEVRRVYTNYLSLALKKDLREYRSIIIKIFAFLLFGVAVLTLSYFLEGFKNRLIADTVNIIGGFAVWEAAEVFFFTLSEKKKDIAMKIRLINAEWKTKS